MYLAVLKHYVLVITFKKYDQCFHSIGWIQIPNYLEYVHSNIVPIYKITQNLIAIPISDFLVPLVRPSRHYHPLSYRLITATTDYYNFSFFSKSCISQYQKCLVQIPVYDTCSSSTYSCFHIFIEVDHWLNLF